jgi:hypothetical protein
MLTSFNYNNCSTNGEVYDPNAVHPLIVNQFPITGYFYAPGNFIIMLMNVINVNDDVIMIFIMIL